MIVHAPREPERVGLRPPHIELELHRSRRDAVTLEIGSAQRRVEVACSTRIPTTQIGPEDAPRLATSSP